MVAYLANGWFTQVGPVRLRAEVVDGALDVAAGLLQAEVPVEAIESLHLRVRTLAFLLICREHLSKKPKLSWRFVPPNDWLFIQACMSLSQA